MTDPTYGISELVNRTVLIVSVEEREKPDLDLKYMLANLGDGSTMVVGTEAVCQQLRALKLPQRVTIRRQDTHVIGSQSWFTYYLEKPK